MRGRGRRRRPFRSRGEELELEQAFSEAWAQRWEATLHAGRTPAGISFPSPEAWRTWLQRAQARYPDLDLLAFCAASCGANSGIVVFFQERSGRWVDATIIEELVMLTRSDHAARRRCGPGRSQRCDESGTLNPKAH